MTSQLQAVVYLAGPLFTQAERDWNARMAEGLRAAEFAVILPQEGASELIRPDQPLPVRRLYELALDGIRRADCIVAVLDGSDPDSGTAFECGYAHALGKPVIGVRSDFRLGGDDPTRRVNLMLSQACAEFVLAVDLELDRTVEAVAKNLKRMLPMTQPAPRLQRAAE